MKLLKLLPVVGLALAGTLAAPSIAGAASSHWHHGHHHRHHHAYVCTGGQVPAGTYSTMYITGVCFAEAGNVSIHDDLVVAPGALFDSITAGDPTSGPVVPATVDVGGSVFVGKGAALLFGCSPNITCSSGITYDSVRGSVRAFDAQGVVLHSASVGGDVSILGGGGGAAADTCAAQKAGAPLVTSLEPWSKDATLYFTPVYSDVEDTAIGGDLTVAGLDSCWLGAINNQIQGSARFFHNSFGDPDGTEVINNYVQGNLGCEHNVPAAQFGDTRSAPNVVGGHAFGECGFKVTDPSPVATKTTPAGIAEHISVSLWHLSKYHGALSSISKFSLPPVTTISGDTIGGTIYNFALSGSGLVGSGTYNPKKPPGATGEAVLSTTYPDGWTQFTAYLTCKCSFGGQSGTITVRAYGMTSPHGTTSGTFLVTSGGGAKAGSLSTLAGGGTFNSCGEPSGTIRVKEYLAIT